MTQIEKLISKQESWQERDIAVHREYSRLCEVHREGREQLINSFMKNLLERIVYLGTKSLNPLLKTSNSIRNYDLNILSKKLTAPPDSIRGALFKDGLFYSLRLRENNETILQHNIYFYKTNEGGDIPRIVSRILRDYGNGQIAQSFLPPKYPLESNEFFEEPVPSLVMNMHRLVDQEASSNPPWPSAYSLDELKNVRIRADIRHVQRNEIKYNPELNEPYL